MTPQMKRSNKSAIDFSIGPCKLCNGSGPLHPRSHVIPQWMNDTMLQSCWVPNPAGLFSATKVPANAASNTFAINKHRMRIVSSYPKEYQQKSPTGVWGTFVCKSCEDRFGLWDDYGATVLRQMPVLTDRGWNFGQYDFDKLIRFFLSILWRMHACEYKFFSKVDLGPHAVDLANFLLNDNGPVPQDFEVMPTWSSHIFSLGVMTPIKVQIESVPYWQIYLPRFQALIKIEPGLGAPCLQPFVMSARQPLTMIEKQFTEFDEINTVKQVVTENRKKKNAKRKNT